MILSKVLVVMTFDPVLFCPKPDMITPLHMQAVLIAPFGLEKTCSKKPG